MSYAYKNLKTPRNTGSGVADFVLIAPVYDFEEGGIKVPVAPFTDPGDEVTIKGSHVFKSERAFAKFQLAPEKNKLDATTIGDKGFNKLDQTLEVFIPGSYAEAHEAVKNLLNTPLIALSPDADCGANMYYQLGTSCVYAFLTVDFSTGTTKDGNKGYIGKINYAAPAIFIYQGSVAVLNDNGSVS
jgi:hypothetical protein